MEEDYYHLELPIEAIRTIHIGLSQAVEKWSGETHKSKRICLPCEIISIELP